MYSIAVRGSVSPSGGGAGGGFSNYVVILILSIEAMHSIAEDLDFLGGTNKR
jgi:hypothetical protein